MSGPGQNSQCVPDGLRTFREFWPYYVREHQHPISRVLHVCGTLLSLVSLLYLVWNERWAWLWLVPVCGYAFAWAGHFVFERNRPATFRYPLFSLAGDLVMLFKVFTFQMGRELERVQDKKREL